MLHKTLFMTYDNRLLVLISAVVCPLLNISNASTNASGLFVSCICQCQVSRWVCVLKWHDRKIRCYTMHEECNLVFTSKRLYVTFHTQSHVPVYLHTYFIHKCEPGMLCGLLSNSDHISPCMRPTTHLYWVKHPWALNDAIRMHLW